MAQKFFSNVNFVDNVDVSWGTDEDFTIYHISGDNYITNDIGDIYIRQRANDKDMLFQNDDGSGDVETYFFLDGSNGYTSFPDSKILGFGAAGDLTLQHDGNNSYINANGTGDLIIKQMTDDKDLILQCDDGSGGTTAYLTLDGSAGLTVSNVNMKWNDGVSAVFGTGGDSLVRHTGTNMEITNTAGSIVVTGTPVNFGVDDTGIDVKFFGATSGKYMQWDESADTLLFPEILSFLI